MQISDYRLSDEQMKQTIHLGCDVTFGEVRLGVELIHKLLYEEVEAPSFFCNLPLSQDSIDPETSRFCFGVLKKAQLLELAEMGIRSRRKEAMSFLTWHRFDVQNALHSIQFVVEMWLLITTDDRLLPS